MLDPDAPRQRIDLDASALRSRRRRLREIGAQPLGRGLQRATLPADVLLDLAVAQVDGAVREGSDVGFVGHQQMVLPASCSRANSPMISLPVFESRLPVGSSASRIDGLLTSARAIATR